MLRVQYKVMYDLQNGSGNSSSLPFWVAAAEEWDDARGTIWLIADVAQGPCNFQTRSQWR